LDEAGPARQPASAGLQLRMPLRLINEGNRISICGCPVANNELSLFD
jgi:hypothetical protein